MDTPIKPRIYKVDRYWALCVPRRWIPDAFIMPFPTITYYYETWTQALIRLRLIYKHKRSL